MLNLEVKNKVKVGSFCSYQLAHTEANFTATVDISAVSRGDDATTELTYPRFPLHSGSDFVSLDRQSESEEALISSLVVDEVMINNIEEASRGQSCLSVGRKNVNTDLLLQNLTLSQKGGEILTNLQPTVCTPSNGNAFI